MNMRVTQKIKTLKNGRTISIQRLYGTKSQGKVIKFRIMVPFTYWSSMISQKEEPGATEIKNPR